ncbi:MBOAT family O-acyltransferase [Clostridium sp. MB40-C1]|uniref:MBOAT family O-acyltransferase n=1 Tax=Clostridium sp. MB40-C1 TaxID=3070996 RepID=UPI0027E08EC1|nr:MBOAT family O-acyltransferase [Clostridium sp. MB40-C1]WMJ82393.1 MBOAT family O-acyltransferase [Clostridium sp. MB40-C1]
MLFNSFKFIIFFPIVVAMYFIISHRYRWILLLGASYYFYMCWNPKYVVLILTTTLISYLSGIWIEGTQDIKKKKIYLNFSILSNIAILFLFKYFNFFNDSFRQIFAHFNLNYTVPSFKLLLPVGISFYTFQSLSYSIDVYRGVKKAERHFGIFALYVSFFPQLVAGPIERSDRLLPQFYEKHKFDYKRVTDGLKLMGMGYFKKVVIADRLAILVNTVYNNPSAYKGVPLIVASVFFAFQIYCDFSGYSDIAVGSAKVMGFELMENFKRPYFSKSISEFWRRWHISLSTWFRDYLYIPLGGNRVKKGRYFFNNLITFLVSGLWHGASWTFVIWGGLHGVYLIIGSITKNTREKFAEVIGLKKSPKIYKSLKVLITFILVDFAWIFFRANSISDAIYIIKNLFNGLGDVQGLNEIKDILLSLGLDKVSFGVGVIAIVIMEIAHLIQARQSLIKFIREKPILIRWTFYYALILTIMLFGVFEQSQFIYFQF